MSYRNRLTLLEPLCVLVAKNVLKCPLIRICHKFIHETSDLDVASNAFIVAILEILDKHVLTNCKAWISNHKRVRGKHLSWPVVVEPATFYPPNIVLVRRVVSSRGPLDERFALARLDLLCIQTPTCACIPGVGTYPIPVDVAAETWEVLRHSLHLTFLFHTCRLHLQRR